MEGADAAVVVTEWPELRDLPWSEARAVMRTALVIDGRNHLAPAELKAAGFTYEGVGRVESVFEALPETREPQPELEQQ
jgi:UDPglucose 6-dehydrogenase